jgi:prophage DNA circulation protein
MAKVQIVLIEDAKKRYMKVVEGREEIGGYPVAECASKMPWMTDQEFAELQESVAIHGLIDKIEMNASDEIVDGRNRMLAVLAQDIDPEFKYSPMDEDVELAEVRNLRRRHLDPAQRALLYIKLYGRPVVAENAEAEPQVIIGPRTHDEQNRELLTEDDTKAAEKKGNAFVATDENAAVNMTIVELKKGKHRDKDGTKSLADHAKEAGVSESTMKRTGIVMRDGIPAVIKAVESGVLAAKVAAKIAALPKEEQAAALKAEMDKLEEKKQPVSEAAYDVKKNVESFMKKVSTFVAKAPGPLRDEVHRRIGEAMGSTVRLERETSDLMNSEGVVPYVEQLVAEMPRSERSGAEKALAEKYGSVVTVKDAEGVLLKIASLIESLSDREKKKVCTALADQHKEFATPPEDAEAAMVQVMKLVDSQGAMEKKKLITVLGDTYKSTTVTKASDYLPKLPDDHVLACETVQKEIRRRVDQLVGFEEWEVNGRRNAGRSLKKATLSAMQRLARHAALESKEGPVLIETQYPEHLDNDDFKSAWNEWLDAKARQKKPVSVETQKRQINILKHFDNEQCVEILTNAMQRPWHGIPVFRELAETDWAGRAPAHPPADYVRPAGGTAKPNGRRIPNVPTKGANVPDRSVHGRLNTGRVPTPEEARAALNK